MSNITVKVDAATTDRGAVYVRVQTSSVGLPSAKVFAIEVLPKAKDSTVPKYRLSHVCSVSEMEELPEDEPGDCCYFRTNDIGMIFDTAVLADATVDIIKADVAKLADEYTKLYELITGSTVTPEPGPDDPSLIPNIYYEDL